MKVFKLCFANDGVLMSIPGGEESDSGGEINAPKPPTENAPIEKPIVR